MVLSELVGGGTLHSAAAACPLLPPVEQGGRAYILPACRSLLARCSAGWRSCASPKVLAGLAHAVGILIGSSCCSRLL